MASNLLQAVLVCLKHELTTLLLALKFHPFGCEIPLGAVGVPSAASQSVAATVLCFRQGRHPRLAGCGGCRLPVLWQLKFIVLS